MLKYLKTVFAISFFFVLTSVDAEQIKSIKEEMWNAMSIEVDHWVDGIGYPIDKEIKDTVIALNLLGIETKASCEGHLDSGLSHPWVDIQIYQPTINEVEEFLDIQEQIRSEELLLRAKFPNLSYNDFYHTSEGKTLQNLTKKLHHLENTMTQNQIKSLEPLNLLLTQFYENHKASYDNTLVIDYHRLRSIGADRQQIRSEEQKLHKLNEYQSEMKAFTIFLKQKFKESE